MARGVNKVILLGSLGADPEMRFTQSGSAVANMRLATNEEWKDKEGQKQERTEWHSIAIFGKLAEIAGQYLRKGAQVYVEGSLRTRKWQDKDGADRYTTEIVANEMRMLGGKQQGEQRQTVEIGGGHMESRLATVGDDFDEDSDIPF